MNGFFSFNTTVIYTTWIILFFCCIFSLIARKLSKKPDTIFGYITRSYVRFFMNMVEQTFGYQVDSYAIFIGSLFTFILLCNYISLLPGFTEPTENINTTLALSLICFFYTQYQAIYAHGVLGYLKEYIHPFFLLFPLHILGKISTMVSMACRLFGNIYGGAMIVGMWKSALAGSFILQTLGIITGINILMVLFFGLFEGFIQAFVFTVLTLTYLAMAVQPEEID